ncbi:hypothetical protein [Emticicia soli]|uniref:Uncharacterized protein n=1 Tax=Emticicia soli TaxID=2027878 RepID=A0ABW5J8Z2_9BACT
MKNNILFLILSFSILIFSCRDKEKPEDDKPKKLSEEEVISILKKNNLKDDTEEYKKINSTPDTIRLERRFSKSLSKNDAIRRIQRFYETIIKHIIDNKDASVIDLVQNSYGFDYGPIAKIIKKHNINPDSTLIRLYPALSQDGFMTMIVTLEDLESNETVTAEYPVKLSRRAPNDNAIQDEISDDICPSAPSCPKTNNPLMSDEKIGFYKSAIRDLIKAKTANR